MLLRHVTFKMACGDHLGSDLEQEDSEVTMEARLLFLSPPVLANQYGPKMPNLEPSGLNSKLVLS